MDEVKQAILAEMDSILDRNLEREIAQDQTLAERIRRCAAYRLAYIDAMSNLATRLGIDLED